MSYYYGPHGSTARCQWAKERSLELQEFHWNAMKRGPYYRDGELRIPAYVYDPDVSPRANEEWKQRGFRWHAEAKEWRRPMAKEHADDQVLKARRRFTHYWNIELNPFKLATTATAATAAPS